MRMSDAPEVTVTQAEILIATYLQPGCATEVNISDQLRNSINDSLVKGNAGNLDLIIGFKLAQAEIVKIMALGAFPRFLMSTNFGVYRSESIKIATASLASRQYARVSMDTELEKLLVSTSWLKGLLTSVENLPVCVSLASANKQMKGFPLIYVNAAFETCTGYNRSEIIGQNCRFLQVGKEEGHLAEAESINQMTEGLRDGKLVKVTITNFRKDGTPFRNLLAMKPILDSDGEYAFVLGIQFDVGQKDASPEKIRLIDALFSVIPNTIMYGADVANMAQ